MTTETMETLSAREIVDQIAKGQTTATQCVERFLATIDARNEANGAFLTTCHERAMEAAKKVDAAITAGKPVGSLAGLPVAIKDGICTQGLTTTAGSKMLSNYVPPYSATIVERLEQAGAIVVGKTNMDEFAMGSSNENSAYRPAKNPWNLDRVPGGSSGGSAVCVAADMAPVAIGSDTGGSIRQPASFCGITGLKPTYGRVSRYGLIAFASSLDQIGPMTRSAEDSAIVMQAIAGHDPRDSTSAARELEDFCGPLNQPIKGMKIGIVREHFESGLNEEVRARVDAAIEVLKSLGATVCDVTLPYNKYAIAAYYVIAPCEASSNLSRFDGVRYTNRAASEDLETMYEKTRAEFFGPEVKKRILLGTYALSSGYYDAFYLKASRVRRMIKNDYDRAFADVDLIVGPTVPTTAFRFNAYDADPVAMYLADIYTVSANLAGVPAISIPCGFDSGGLPVGLQLQAPRFGESKLLRAAHQFQGQTEFHRQKPAAASGT